MARNDLLAVVGPTAGRHYIVESLSGAPRATPDGGNTLYSPAFNPAGTLLALGDYASPFLRVTNIATGSFVTLTGGNPAGRVLGAAFSPDGSLLATTGNLDPRVTVYNTSDWSKVTVSTQPAAGTGASVAFSPDGSLLAVTYSNSPYLLVYDTSDWSSVTITGGDPGGIPAHCHFSPNGNWLAVTRSGNPSVVVYDTSDWSKETISASLSGGYACRFSPDSSQLAVGGFNSPYLTVYNTSTWGTESITGSPLTARATTARWEPNGEFLVVTNAANNSFHVFDSSLTYQSTHAIYDDTYAFLKGLTGTAYEFDLSAVAPRFIRGTVLDENGDEADRTVNVYRRSDSKLVGSTVSDAVTGEYELELVDGDINYDVQFVAASGDSLNDLFYARVQSGDT